MEPNKQNRLPAAGRPRAGPSRETTTSRSLSNLLDTTRFEAPPAAAPEAAAPAGPVLRIRDSSGEQRTFALDRDEILLGRQTVNDIQFLESHVSKKHARIRREGDEFRLFDVGSKAGVFVNGNRIEDQILVDGDVITFGLSPIPTLLFSLSGADTTVSGHSKIRDALQTSTGEQSLEKLARFLEFNRIIGNRISLNEILENVVDIAVELTDAERGFLILRGPDDRLDYRLARDRDKRALPPGEIRVSETIARNAMTRGESRVVSDVLEEESLSGQESVLSLHLRSAIALPLRSFSVQEGKDSKAVPIDEVFGVLYLDSRQARSSFTRLDRNILETLANNASSVIENARLYGEAEEKRKMDEEFARAREVQEALQPKGFWSDDHFEIAGCCIPCLQLGGDYLDQFRLPDGGCCVVIADVAGKGMAAALLAAALQGMMAAETSIPQSFAAMVSRLNRSVCRLAPEGRFVTFFCATLTPDGHLTFVNAGHTPPLVASASGEIRSLSSGAMALGFRDTAEYRDTRCRLERGDAILFYTDGVTEAENGRRQLFGEERLEELLRRFRDLPAAEMHRAILDEVGAFCGNQPPRDDVTLLVLKFTGGSAADDGGKE